MCWTLCCLSCFFFFSSRRRHTRLQGDWSSDVCSSDLGPRVAHLLDLRLVRLGGAADHLMTAEAGLHRRDPRLARDSHRTVTVQAGDLILAGVDVVTEEDRLAGAPQPAPVPVKRRPVA